MKIFASRRIAYLFVFGIILFISWNHGSSLAKAAAPAFKEKKIEIDSIGKTYQLEILNKVKGSTYKWSSSDTSVAKVTSKGLITTMNKGSAEIKCKITYSSKKTKTIYCYITVTIPADKIEISNVEKKNGAFIMRVGDRYNFNRTLTPTNSSDLTYWYLDASNGEANPNAVRIDDSSSGKVTALRRGKIVLVAAAAKEASQEAAKMSEIKDAIIIEVVGVSPEVISADIVNSKQIKVAFGTTIRESTIISGGRLSSNITIDRLADSGTTAKDPGILTAALSSNLRTLTITASNYFDGSYSISFNNGILTTDGTALYPYSVKLKYPKDTSNENVQEDDDDYYDDPIDYDETEEEEPVIDLTAPELASVELDDSGMITVINFKEKMDFSDFKVSGAKAALSTAQVQASTISFLNNKSNYSFSSDGKSIYINLTDISTLDYNKVFLVTISGLTDTSGNKLAEGSLVVSIRTETAPKPQARPLAVMRTSYNIITATFDRSIKDPGYVMINNGSYYYGEVDADNRRLVHYKISSYDAALTGTQKVSIGHWEAYNVIAQDTYANNMYDFSVYFITEDIRPLMTNYSYNPDLKILTLTYNENVSLRTEKGYLEYAMNSGRVDTGKGYIEYAKANVFGNVIEITLKNISLYGNYTLTIPEGFVLDDYRNQSFSATATIIIGNGTEGTHALAEPFSVYQSEDNHSFIFVEFAEKLDEASAVDKTNYYMYGAVIDNAVLIRNDMNGALVRLTLTKGSVATSGKHKITVSGLKGYNGSSSEMVSYSTDINIIENKDPEFKSIQYNATTKNTIEMKFTEAIKGTMVVNVQDRSTGAAIGNTITVNGDTVYITLSVIPADGTYLKIFVTNNSITDLSGNGSTINPEYTAFVNY